MHDIPQETTPQTPSGRFPRFLEPAFAGALTTALTVALGMGILRAILPLLLFGIRDRFRWSALGVEGSLRLAGLVFLLFASAFLVGPLARALGIRRVFALGALGCGFATVAAQLWPGDPLGLLVILALGLFALLVHLPAAHLVAQGHGRPEGFAVALLGGLLLDSAIHGLWGTFDPVWRRDLGSLALVVALVALLLFCLRRTSTDDIEHGDVVTGLGPRWLALGPWLFLELLLFGNLARLGALSGGSAESTWRILLLGRTITWLVVLMLAAPGRPGRRGSLLASAVLLVVTAFAWPVGGPASLLLVVGQVASGLLLLALAGKAGRPVEASGAKPQNPGLAWNGAASLAFFVLLFLYYAAYDLPLPFTNTDLLPLAGLLVALATLGASRGGLARRGWGDRLRWPGGRVLAGAMGLLLLAALLPSAWARVSSARADEPVTRSASGGPRVMSYNIHCGFGPAGLLALERQARVIEAQDPDVVALQEVSRGWVINGSVDTLGWLARRLGMEAHFAPTADPLWGNAVLSRLPIRDRQSLALPAEGRRIRRGLLAVELETKAGDPPLWIFATHLHHRHRDSAVRQVQTTALLDFWRRQGSPPAALLGDLNAVPGTPEITLLTTAGFRDAVADAGLDPAPTFRSDALERRLDYILLHGPWHSEAVVVPGDPASDHLAVAATLLPRTHPTTGSKGFSTDQ